MHKRVLNLPELVKEKSLFLLGPRQTGKSTLLRKAFPDAHRVDLLESETYRELASHPELLRQRLPFERGTVVIDEIQLLPVLLNEVHLLIERHKSLRFVLTGSSARKLQAGSANLLAGRAWNLRFHPLVSEEIPTTEAAIARLWNHGGLPAIYDGRFPRRDLRAYVGSYLQEEIRAEGLVRSAERFSRFLDVAAFCNGEIVNFTKVGNDAGIPPRTVQEYFRILEDTLLGTMLPPLVTVKKRKPVATAKFFLFDVGVANTLLKRGEIEEGSEAFGRALEHLVFCELRAFLDYGLSESELCFWRTLQSGFEVDFVVNGRVGIEVKASSKITPHDERGLLALAEELPKLRKIIVCRERKYRKTDSGVEIFPLREFLGLLWKGEFFA